MIAYLDTNVVVRLMQGNGKQISRKAGELLNRADLLISPMVVVELEFLYELQRTKSGWSGVESKLSSEIGLTVCDFSFPRIATIAADEKWTRDPFDRLIVAHAKANGFAFLISADAEIAQNYPRTVW